MVQSLLKQMFPCTIGVAQGIVVIIKKALLKFLSFSFPKSVLLILLPNLISGVSGNSKITVHKSANDKKIGGLSHVPQPMS